MARSDIVARLVLLMGGGDNLKSAIAKWQAQTDLVHVAGPAAADFAGTTAYVNGSIGLGVTVIAPEFAIRQDGYVRQVKVNVKVATGETWKYKVFRYNTGTAEYDMVGEEAFTPTIAGVHTHTLSSPIAVQMADIPGIWIPGHDDQLYYYNHSRTIVSRYVTGEVTTSNAFAGTLATDPEVESLAYPPYLAMTGDSIVEGHNGDTNWHGDLHDGAGTTRPGGEPTSEIANQIRAKIGSGSTLYYQNLALGSQTFDWVQSTGIDACVAARAHTVVILCGVNDIETSRTWAAALADLNTIKTDFDAGVGERLMLCEILPWTNGTDGEVATVRTWNANIAAWCASNGAILIPCHDPMGQIRVSTGELDDLLAAYDQDGVHLTAAGVDVLATIIAQYLERYP